MIHTLRSKLSFTTPAAAMAYPIPKRYLPPRQHRQHGYESPLAINTRARPLLSGGIERYRTGHLPFVSTELLNHPASQEIPRVNLPILAAADDDRVGQAETRPDPVVPVGVTVVALQHLPVTLVHQADRGVEGRNEDGVAVTRLLNGGDGLYSN